MADTFTPTQMPNFFDVNFFPLFQLDAAREVAERGVRTGGGTKPLGQPRSFPPGSTVVFVREGVLGSET